MSDPDKMPFPKLYDKRVQQVLAIIAKFPEPRAGFTRDEHIVMMTVMFCDQLQARLAAIGVEAWPQ